MSSTIYSQFKLFSLNASHPVACGVIRSTPQHKDFFSDQSAAVYVLFVEIACSNVYPSNRHWSIGFIGTEIQFNAFSDYMAYLFDDGLARSIFIRNGTAWRNYQKTLMGRIKPITPDAMQSMGFAGCCFPYEAIKTSETLTSIIESPDTKYYTFYREPRCVISYNSDENIQRMVAASLFLTSQSDETRFTQTPWVLTRSRSRAQKYISRAEAERHLDAE